MSPINKFWKIAAAFLTLGALIVVGFSFVKRKHAQTIWADGRGYLSCKGDATVKTEGNGRYAISFTVPTGYHDENRVELHGVEKVQIEDAPQDEVNTSCK